MVDVVFKGDISPEVHGRIVDLANFHLRDSPFANPTSARMDLKEVEAYRRAEDGKLQVRVVYETMVERDMLNRANTMHGGCAAFVVDVSSSLAMASLGMVQGKPSDFVSQALNTRFHAPAPLGAKLMIVGTTTSFGARTVTAQAESLDLGCDASAVVRVRCAHQDGAKGTDTHPARWVCLETVRHQPRMESRVCSRSSRPM